MINIKSQEQAQAYLPSLEYLRGLAGLMVVAQHLFEIYSPEFYYFSATRVRFGEWGVLIFFLISGYLIPQTVVRHPSLGSFVINRVFRLFPVYLVVTILAWWVSWPNAPVREILAALTLTQHLLHMNPWVGASWTLHYEWLFYLATAVLLLYGGRNGLKRAAFVALLLPVLGMILWRGSAQSASLGEFMQDPASLWRTLPWLLLAAFWLWRRRVRGAALAGALLAVVLVLLNWGNGHKAPWFNMMLWSTYAMGVLLYLLPANSRILKLVMAVYLGVILVQFWRMAGSHPVEPPWLPAWRPEHWLPYLAAPGAIKHWWTDAVAFVAALPVFILMLRWRPARPYRVLGWLGSISYPLYLIHGEVIRLVGGLTHGHPVGMVLSIALALGLAWLIHRLIELPGIRLGKRMSWPLPTN